MHEGSLGIHEVELVVQSCPGLSDGCGVGEHAHSSRYLCKVCTRHDGGRLVVDANLYTLKELLLDWHRSIHGGERLVVDALSIQSKEK